MRNALAAVVLWMSAVAAAAPPTVMDFAPGDVPLQQLLQREANKAREAGKVPFVQMTAEWCGPCKKLRASMNDPLMQDAFAGTYIIRLDQDAWKPQLKSVGLKDDPIPMFHVLDEKGRPNGRKISGAAWGEDIPRNMAPPLQKFFRKNGAKP
jgi:thiol-disulfide isomerase/thioredoxin